MQVHEAAASSSPQAAPIALVSPSRELVGSRALVVVCTLAALAHVWAAGGPSRRAVAVSWQLIDLPVLSDDPLGSVWYLHTQPPLHNLTVGIVAALPLPIDGTLMGLYGLALVATAWLLMSILMRWGLRPLAAGLLAAAASCAPGLLSTIRLASYEVPMALLIVTVVWAAQRYLDDPSLRWLMVVAGALTAGTLTRSLLHPLWVVAVLGLLLLARRVTLRTALAAAAIPVVLVGGWMVKNDTVFGQPTLSSWTGFNMTRGVTASMTEEQVDSAIAAGSVSELARMDPFLTAEEYAPVTDECRPWHHRPVTDEPFKEQHDDIKVSNFNYECYLPLYRQARRDALALVGREPGRYLLTRLPPLAASFEPVWVGLEGDTTALDELYEPFALTTDVTVGMKDWNLPFLSAERIDIRVSWTLAFLSLFVLARGAVAVFRLLRQRRDRHDWPTTELAWIIVALTVGLVVVGGALVEFGENARFRTAVDPLLVALPPAWLLRRTSWAGRPDARP